MSYTALYRKFRPSEFDDVKGQDHIVTTLKNQIASDRIGHAYLFCGTRGTGKTTVAKILAKAVNCTQAIDGSPCGECNTCIDIGKGASMDVIEIDAASNNGVESIREIRDAVQYRPASSKYKVFIIDEAHMITNAAFNALLKTLEEPPSYVIFIFATTELHKVPITIISRCQHYEFKRITIETITDRLRMLMQTENIEVEESALRYIAKVADGSMRDALSILDQCIAFYIGESLTYDNVLKVLGAVDTSVYSALLRQIASQEVAAALSTIEYLIMEGRELGQLVNDFTWYMRNLLLLKSSDQLEDVLDVSSENLQQLKEETQMIEGTTLLRFIRIFSELSNQLRYATQKRILLEVAVIKLCTPAMEQGDTDLTERVRSMEQKIEKGVQTQVVYQQEGVQSSKVPIKKELPKAVPEDVEKVAREFKGIVNQADGLLKTYLKQAKPSVSPEGNLLLVFENKFTADYLNLKEHQQELTELIEGATGKTIQLKVESLDQGVKFTDVYHPLSDIINFDITEENE